MQMLWLRFMTKIEVGPEEIPEKLLQNPFIKEDVD